MNGSNCFPHQPNETMDSWAHFSSMISPQLRALEFNLIHGPLTKDLVAGIIRLVTATPLVTIFVSCLHIQRFAKELATFDVGNVDAILKQTIVFQQLGNSQIAGIVGTVQRQRRHTAGNSVTCNATSLITAQHGRKFGRYVIAKIGDVVNK